MTVERGYQFRLGLKLVSNILCTVEAIKQYSLLRDEFLIKIVNQLILILIFYTIHYIHYTLYTLYTNHYTIHYSLNLLEFINKDN